MNEVFAETFTTQRCPDFAGFILNGEFGPDFDQRDRRLYRVRYNAAAGAVEWQLLATLNARIVAIETDPDSGVQTAVIAGRDRFDGVFMLRLPMAWLQQPNRYNRRIKRAIINKTSAATYVMPGRLCAMVRAWLQLSAEGEPMPRNKSKVL